MLRVVEEGDEAGPRLWIGYALHPDFWGQRYATALARVLVGVGVDLRVPVWADAFTDNPASRRVLEKVGLRQVGQVIRAGRPMEILSNASEDSRAGDV